MKIAIIGAGAIGSLVGGFLARAGHGVTLIGRQDHIEAISQNGLMIDGVCGTFQIPLNTALQLDFTPDVSFLTVKSQDVETTCRAIRPYMDNTPLVVMQNGIRVIEEAGAILGKENVIGAILLLNARFLSPGKVTYVNKGPILLGEALSRGQDWVQSMQSLLSDIAPTHITTNIIGAQWTKLFINAMSNSIDGMTNLTMGEVVRQPVLMKIGVAILKEALRVIEKANITLESLPGVNISLFKIVIKAPTPVAVYVMKRSMLAKGDADIITSTLQSLRRGKKTEVDYLNGEFVRLGQRVHMPTPYNSAVVDLIHEVEATKTFFAPEELATRFSFDHPM